MLVGIGEPTLHVRFVCLLRSITTDEPFEIIVPLGITDEGGTGGREGVNNYAANPSFIYLYWSLRQ